MHFFEMSLFFPDWLTPWIGIAAVAAWIMGLGRLAAALGIYVAMDIFAAPLIEAWLGELPLWALVLAAPFVVLIILNSLISLVFGKEVAGQVIGTWLVRLTDNLVLPLAVAGLAWWLLMA